MSIDLLKQALLEKKAEVTANDENHLQREKNNVYPDPPPSAESSVAPYWGTPPPVDQDGQQVIFSEGVQREQKNVRQDLLARLFRTMPAASAADKKLIKEHFDHAGEIHGHSPLLNDGTSLTLREQVRGRKPRG